MAILGTGPNDGRTYGGYVAPADDRYPNDPAADSMEAMQEYREREHAVTLTVRGHAVTRAEVQAYPFTVLRALRERVPTLTWVKCGAFEVALISDGERHANGPTLAAVLCEYLEI